MNLRGSMVSGPSAGSVETQGEEHSSSVSDAPRRSRSATTQDMPSPPRPLDLPPPSPRRTIPCPPRSDRRPSSQSRSTATPRSDQDRQLGLRTRDDADCDRGEVGRGSREATPSIRNPGASEPRRLRTAAITPSRGRAATARGGAPTRQALPRGRACRCRPRS